jgi:plasmid maintenance system antidote protein VapI
MAESWAELLRRSIDNAEQSRYAIAKAAEVQESQIARFMAGASINLETAERIGRVLGIELKAPKQPRKKGQKGE